MSAKSAYAVAKSVAKSREDAENHAKKRKRSNDDSEPFVNLTSNFLVPVEVDEEEDDQELSAPSQDSLSEPRAAVTAQQNFTKLSHQPEWKGDLLTIVFEPGDYCTISGIYDLQVITGVACVYDAFLPASSILHRVYAPLTHALPTITSEIPGTTIMIRSVQSSLPLLNKFSPIWNRLWWPIEGNVSFELIRSVDQDSILRGVVCLPSLQPARHCKFSSDNKGRGSTIMLVGPKGSGKSTYARCMLNYYLTEPNKKQDSCYWLDIDPGQPEFGPSGQISLIKVSQPLLGPSFSNQASRSSQTCKLIKSHALAANSPGEDIEHYLACVLDLVNHLQKINGLRRDPLLINCPGWVIGSGLDILERVISNLSLSTIILLDNTGDTIEAGRHIWNAASSRNVEVCEVVSQHSRPPYRPAAEFRAMQSMSYFHSSQNREGFWHGVPLANLQPISLPYASEQRYNVTTVMSYYSIMQTTQIPAILEGQMVALVVITSPNAFAAPNSKFFDEASNATSFTTDAKTGLSTLTSVNADKAQITVTTPLTPKFSHCLGQAIVQKVDTNTKTFHLSTPVTMNDIRTALQSSGFETEEEEYPYLVLVRGRFDSPDWSFLERLYNEERCTNKISNTRSRSVDWDLSEEEEEDCQIYENDDQSNDQIIINESSRLVSHPYVTIRDVPTSAMTNADSGSTRSISTIKKPGEGGVTAAVLSGKVWRPRYLPRNGRQGQ